MLHAMEVIDTLVANEFALVLHQVLRRGAEHAAVLVFLKNDAIVFNKNLHFIVLRDIQSSSKLDGENDSA